MIRNSRSWVCPLVSALAVIVFPAIALAANYKVLTVMSYENDHEWQKGVRHGIETALAGQCDLTHVALETLTDKEGGPEKAKRAYDLFQQSTPDGVIASDDAAQSMFVVPYLRGKVKTPVVFCGVNAEPEEYGYPAENVTGVLERVHFKESIALVQQLAPGIRKIAYLLGNDKTGQSFIAQARKEMGEYGADSVVFEVVDDITQGVKKAQELRAVSDALFIDGLQPIRDEQGNKMNPRQSAPLLAKAYGKPTLAGNDYLVETGVLCGVSKSAEEQGTMAARMLLEAMKGKPVSEIPIVRNHYGKRIINATTLKELGLQPDPSALKGAKLVTTTP